METSNAPENISLYETIWHAFRQADLSTLAGELGCNDFPQGRDRWIGRVWLHTAIETANPQAVAWMLARGVDVNIEDDEGYTALTTALEVEHDLQIMEDDAKDAHEAVGLTIELLDLLLDAGAQINKPLTLQKTALHVAAVVSSARVVQHLLDRGANPRAIAHDYQPEFPIDLVDAREKPEVYAVLKAAMEKTEA